MPTYNILIDYNIQLVPLQQVYKKIDSQLAWFITTYNLLPIDSFQTDIRNFCIHLTLDYFYIYKKENIWNQKPIFFYQTPDDNIHYCLSMFGKPILSVINQAINVIIEQKLIPIFKSSLSWDEINKILESRTGETYTILSKILDQNNSLSIQQIKKKIKKFKLSHIQHNWIDNPRRSFFVIT